LLLIGLARMLSMNSLPPVNASLLYTVAAAFLLSAASAYADLTLVKDGQPSATIITLAPAEPPPAANAPRGKKRGEAAVTGDARAAQLLVEWIKKITGVELPIGTEAKAGTTAIYLGKAALQAGLKLDDIVSPSREGLRISADDKRVLIAGQTDEATLKAACRFLEELGCRYFMDGPLGEVYPHTKTLAVGRLAITEKPGLIGRNPKGPSFSATAWKAWNGGGGDMVGHSHSWGGYVSPALFDQHPDWFAMGSDGQRHAGGWICTSNPELRKHFANNVIAAIEAGTRNPSISPTDGRGYCQCPTCKAQDDPKSLEPSTNTIAITNRYTDFFDDIGRRVAAVHPESVLGFYCYADYTQPPTNGRKLSPNLCAVIAPIRYCRLHEIGHPGCVGREQQVDMTERWAAVASKLGYYNYMYNLADGTLPFFKFTACKKEFPYLVSKGLSYMTIEMLSNWHIYGPQIYLSLRLAYDPAANADAIMEDYWQKFYGPKAGPFMKEYWMGIDAAQEQVQTHAGSFFGLAQIYTPVFLKLCEARLTKAAQAAKGDDLYEKRVAMHAEGFRSAADYQAIAGAMNSGNFAMANTMMEAMIARLHKLAEEGIANREYATSYIERFLSKPVRQGAAATAAPNKVLQVLPDRWRFAFDEEDQGNAKHYDAAKFDDSKWPAVATYSATLDSQGYDKNSVLWYRTKLDVPAKHGKLALFFGEVDGATEVYLNGQKVEVPAPPAPAKKPVKGAPPAAAPAAPAAPANPPARTGQARPRTPFEVDVTGAVHVGENVVALRVDHTKITDLSLGGILRPVVLIQKPE
jgi:hypothetical protein